MIWRAIPILIAASAMAQEIPPNAATAPPKGAITGVVRDTATGAPVPEAEVFTSSGGRQVRAVTDQQGKYALRDIEAGPSLRVSASVRPAGGGFPLSNTRFANLLPGQTVDGFDFRIPSPCDITGRVLDENGEPVPGLSVWLIARIYRLGAMRYVYTGSGSTDDLGIYHVRNVQAGRPYLLVATRKSVRLDAISTAPRDPKFRRPAITPSFYPNARSIESAEAITVRPGETREGIDIRLVRTTSYCIDGVLETGMGPGEVSFSVAETRPNTGSSGDGAMYIARPNGKTGTDGKFRVCDLHPGDYEIEASTWGARPTNMSEYESFSTANFTIKDEDLHNLRLQAQGLVSLTGEVVWDGDADQNAPPATLNFDLESVTRTVRPSAKVTAPGPFVIQNMILDDFSIRVRGIPSGAYLKEMTYGSHDLLLEPLHPGTAIGNAGMRVVLARDGGSVSVRATNHDGAPVGDAQIVILPSKALSEAAVADAMQSGQSDQTGRWTSGTLPPGKYFILALTAPANRTPESISKLWGSRNKAYELDLGPHGKPQVTVEVKPLD
jgi:hypothetical protein